MSKICLMCESHLIRYGPYYTCAGCNGPCDTFRNVNVYVDSEIFDYPSNEYKPNKCRKDEEKSQSSWDGFREQPFRCKVPTQPLS